MRKIANQYGITELIEVKPNDELCDVNGESNYLNKSYIIGNYRIELGIYEDENKKLASFFHELGHIVNQDKSGHYNSEERAWEIGFEIAKEHGYTFGSNVHKWAKQQLDSYRKGEIK